MADLSLNKDMHNRALKGNDSAPGGEDSVYDRYNSRLGYWNVVPARPWDSTTAPDVESV